MDNEIPKTLDEAIKYLTDNKIDPSTINSRALRNNWGLWSGSDLANWFYWKEIYHADDMSSIIIDSYERTLKNEPINIDDQIAHYHQYWENTTGKNSLSKMRKDVEKYLKPQIRDSKINQVLS